MLNDNKNIVSELKESNNNRRGLVVSASASRAGGFEIIGFDRWLFRV